MSLMYHRNVIGDGRNKKLCIAPHTADAPDLGVDVVYDPIVCIVRIGSCWHEIKQILPRNKS